jgi:hypothetical protein
MVEDVRLQDRDIGRGFMAHGGTITDFPRNINRKLKPEAGSAGQINRAGK